MSVLPSAPNIGVAVQACVLSRNSSFSWSAIRLNASPMPPASTVACRGPKLHGSGINGCLHRCTPASRQRLITCLICRTNLFKTFKAIKQTSCCTLNQNLDLR